VEPVQIVDFPNFDNLQPLVPDEIQIEDLLGFINPEDEHYQAPFNQNVHIGFAQFQQPEIDPVLTSIVSHKCFHPNPEAVRLWVKFFSQKSSSLPTVSIPDAWLSFFTLLLLQSPTFDWAKNILQSTAWDILSANSTGNACIFSLPHSCPLVDIPVCSNFEFSSSAILEEIESEDVADDAPKTPVKRKRVPKSKAHPISEADVRRSQRVKKANKGFKSSSCKDKNCVGCSANPPTVSKHVIRELGKTFCNIDPNELTDEKLTSKPSKSKAAKKNSRTSRDKPTDNSGS
jgi:hypothetical protein